jgi:sugar phosphate isomerase/epimerase
MTLLSMNEMTTFRWSLDEDVENFQQAGYTGIGVWRHKLIDGDEDQAIHLISTSGLTVTNLSWAGGFTGSDGRSLAESIDDAVEALRLGAALQAGCLVIYAGGRNNHTYRHAGRLLRHALDELLPLAETLDVPLAIQPMHAACAADWTFLTDLESLVSLVGDYRSSALKIAYDTYHFPALATQRELLARLVPLLGIVHLGDRRQPPNDEHERCPLGSGRVPLREIVTVLQETGYRGSFDVKLLGSEIHQSNYWTLLEQSQLAFGQFTNAPALRTLA